LIIKFILQTKLMSTKIRLTSLFFFFVFCCSAQDDLESKMRILRDSVTAYVKLQQDEIKSDSSKKWILSSKAFDRYFDNYFTLINYDRESFTEGNSATLKITENSTRLSLSLSHKGRNYIFTAGTVLNVKDNSGLLFSQDKPTTGTQFFINNSFILKQGGGTSLKYDFDKRNENYLNRRKILDSLETEYVYKNFSQLKVLTAKLDALNKSVEENKRMIKAISDEKSVMKYREALLEDLEKQDKIRKSIEAISFTEDPQEKYKALKKVFDEQIVKRQLETGGINSFRLGWITTGVSYKRDNYATYDSTLEIKARISEKPFDSWAFNGVYNVYWQRNPEDIKFKNKKGFNSLYGGISYAVGRTNNFAEMSESSLSIAKTYQQNDTIYQLKSDKKLRDISKKAFNSYWVHRIGIQGTGMIGMKQFFGINLSSNVEISEEKPKYNSRLGLLFRFQDSENQKSIVNFEIFLALNDITDIKNKGGSVWERKEIGISAAVPFQKVFFR